MAGAGRRGASVSPAQHLRTTSYRTLDVHQTGHQGSCALFRRADNRHGHLRSISPRVPGRPYRGERLVYAESEYRGPLMRNGLLGIVAFAPMTTVSNSEPGETLFDSISTSAGGGLR